MLGNFGDRFVRIVTFSLSALIVIGGLVLVYPSFRRGQALKRQNDELQQRIDEKKQEIAALIENQRRFKSDVDFVETIARQNRRVFPGELVFIFEDD